MKRRAAAALAEEIHERYMKAALDGVGWDDALSFITKRLRKITSDATNSGYQRGLEAGRSTGRSPASGSPDVPPR